MEINPSNLKGTQSFLFRTRRDAEVASGRIRAQIGRDFSDIGGVSEAGEIHGRAIQNDPASAKNLLNGFGDQLEWALEVLRTGSEAISSQEGTNSRGLDIADAGGNAGGNNANFPLQPEPGYQQFSYIPPMVMVGASLSSLQSSFSSNKVNQLGDLMSNWSELSSSVQNIANSLDSIASEIESEHDSEFTLNAARKIREMAGDAQHFAANAQQMVSKTGTLSMGIPTYNLQMLADVTQMNLIPEPALQKSFEAANLLKWQATLQNWVTQSLPNQQSMMEPPTASGRGDNVEIGLESIAGTGVRYNTDEVVWPQEIQEAIQSGEIGPGSFGVADGELVALENIDQGLVDQVRQAVADRNEAVYGGGKLQEFINGGMQTLENTGTSAAGLDGIGSGAFNNGVNPGLGQSGAGAAASAGSGIGGLGAGAGSGAMGPLGALGGAGALGGTGNGSAASGIRGGIAGAGLGGARGAGAGGGLSGRGFGAAAGEGGSRVLGGSGESASRAGAGAGVGAHGAGTGAGASQNAHGRGAAGPMMAPGAAGRNQEKKKSGMIKAVTSRVEADKNRRDLLGDPPAALPGPIGDWVRQ